jgi:hypothetical protein
MRGEVGSRPYGRGGVEKTGKLHEKFLLTICFSCDKLVFSDSLDEDKPNR